MFDLKDTTKAQMYQMAPRAPILPSACLTSVTTPEDDHKENMHSDYAAGSRMISAPAFSLPR